MGLSGRPLVVHASLSAFGRVERGADTVVAALRGTCPTVMAPAFCFEPNWTPPPDDRPARNGCDYAYYDGWDRPRIPWRVESATIDRSMGVVSHALCAEPGARRSDHPWHSWLAAGEWAEELTTPHPWTTTNLPLERLESERSILFTEQESRSTGLVPLLKSLRFGEGSIAESYAAVEGEEVWLINSSIPEYSHGNRMNHQPRRPRKLLLKAREIAKLQGAVAREGLTLVPLSIYFNSAGRAKVELAIARGKKMHDKRETIKERDWKREQGRLLRHDG